MTNPMSETEKTGSPPLAAPGASRYRSMPRLQETGLLVVILLLGLLLTCYADRITVQGQEVNNFLRLDNLLPNVATPMSWMAIMSLGVTFVIIAGGIDISVGSIFGLSALGTAAVLQYFPEQASPWVVLPVAVIVPVSIGLLCGFINGSLVVGLRMHPFIVTLGTVSIFRGIGLVSVKTKSLPAWDLSLPVAFTKNFIMYEIKYQRPSGATVALQPVPMLIMLVCFVASWIYLSHTVAGRENYAIGGNEEAARFSGLPVGRIKLRVYCLVGLMAGIAGMISTGYYGSANTGTGEGYELMVIAGAAVGGASMLGGRGTALGAVLGALVIKLIENGIFIIKEVNLGFATLHLSKEYSKIIIGISILLAVAIDRLSNYYQTKRLAGARPDRR